MKFEEMFRLQNEFSQRFFDEKSLTSAEKEEKTKEFSLALHAEVSSLIHGINFKGHSERKDISESKILYESVDVFRYLLAIMNLWKISPDDFISAFQDKENYLTMEHDCRKKQWSGQKVVIVDIDDVLASFRISYGSWLEKKFHVKTDYHSSEYYFTKELKTANISPTASFDAFISERCLRTLDLEKETVDVVNSLHKMGYWIHLLTARPDDNLICKYDTYTWLKNSGILFDRLSFSPEKFIWLSKTDYYRENLVAFAIDDSEKHALEYAKHNILTFCPIRSYNTQAQNHKNVKSYSDPSEILKFLKL